ncbi:MAG: CRISPR-associated endonuclease Cas2 [Alphaproteobacteria bacterium]|nr:CRISPR-associated endonuclease Cas2 [Alphaproteobacteria bacterium]
MQNSAYRLMWMMVMFDLPVVEKAERKKAYDFRQYLLDEGFAMAQYSVYLRFIGSREKCDAFTRRIKQKIPPLGKVDILYFTDKQFATMQSFSMRAKVKHQKIQTSLCFFEDHK